MIKLFLIMNAQGKVRLSRYYDDTVFEKRSTIEQQLFEMTSKLTSQSCNFFKDTEGIYDKKCKIIIRYYGTLYFIVVIDEDESELGILDLTQNIVEVMDRIFESACEMDTLYYPEKMNALIDEVIVAGVVVETNLVEIHDALKCQWDHEEKKK